MQQIVLVSALLAVVCAQFGVYQNQRDNGFGGHQQQQQQQQWPIQQQTGFMQQPQQMGSGDRMGMGADFGRSRGPPFLQNVTRQAASEYYQIIANRSLTKAQIDSAVGNWSTTYNVAAQVTAFNTQQQQLDQQSRQNVTAAVQQLPATLNQIYSIMDNKSLTPSQEQQQIGQIFSNMTYPLNALAGSAIASRGRMERKGRRGDDSQEDFVIFGF